MGVRAADINRGDDFGLTPAGFLYCGLCGALLLEGFEGLHRQHCQDWAPLKDLARRAFGGTP